MAVYDLNVSMLVRELNRVSVSVSPRCILLYKLAWNPTAGCVSDSRRLCGHADVAMKPNLLRQAGDFPCWVLSSSHIAYSL